ncbi:MAG: SET domain-containing protein, partial [Acidimicrobiaceae bacterium]
HRIETGASITFDYAMSDSNSFISFDCECGSARCRKRLKQNDWQLPDLQRRYAGWFAPHIRQLIDGIN